MDKAKDQMFIAQLGPMPPPHGGVSTNMLAIHDELVRQGHRSVIVDVTNRQGNSNAEYVVKPRNAAGLVRYLFTSDADVVHYHIGGEFSLKLAALTILCGLLPGKRSVITFHSGGFAKRVAGNAQWLSLRGFALRSLDLVIGVNGQMMEMFRAYGVGEDRIRMILPFELTKPEPHVELPSEIDSFIARSKPLLLSVGALEPEYLNEFLIRSMPAIVEKMPQVRLVIAGSGSRHSELAGLVDDLGLSERVMLAGNIDHPVLLHLIERADVLLRLTEFDGDAISVREALFLGTPVAATDNGMRPDGVYLLQDPPQVAELVKAVSSLLSVGSSGSSGTVGPSNASKVVETYKGLLSK